MDEFLKSIAMAWNPVGEVRRRRQDGSLHFANTIAPFLGIVIACQLFQNGAHTFFLKMLASIAHEQLQEHPFTSTFAQKMIAALTVLSTLGVVAVLPRPVFRPSSRSEVLSTLLITWTGGVFYQAALGSVALFVSGVAVAVNVQLGLIAFTMLNILTGLVAIVLLGAFWTRAADALELPGGQVALISITALCGLAAFVAMLLLAAAYAPPP